MNGAERIVAERRRQISEEGYDPSHDREHTNGALAFAAACYAAPEKLVHLTQHSGRYSDGVEYGETSWHEPWPASWRRPERATNRLDRIRELEKAGALIAAEIDRLLAEEGS